MPHKLRLYLDTSVVNFIFADDAPEKKEITIDFFENFVSKGRYDTFISDFVITEIEATSDKAKRSELLNVISKYRLKHLPVTDSLTEVERLTEEYTKYGAIPEKKIFDAYHVAVSTINEINYLVSWNFKHLANVNREQKIRVVNISNNYLNELRIITPHELIDYGN